MGIELVVPLLNQVLYDTIVKQYPDGAMFSLPRHVLVQVMSLTLPIHKVSLEE